MTRRTNARLAGSAFLLYIVVGITQMILGAATRADGTAAKLALMAQHAGRVRLNLTLTLVTSVMAFTLAVTLYALTRDEDCDIAQFGFALRAGEGILGAVTPLGALVLLSLGEGIAGPDAAVSNALAAVILRAQVWNTTIIATLFALGSMAFSWLLLRGRIVPALLGWIGVAASVLLVILLPLQLAGVARGPLTLYMWLPMAAFEIPLGVWLIVKGAAIPASKQST